MSNTEALVIISALIIFVGILASLLGKKTMESDNLKFRLQGAELRASLTYQLDSLILSSKLQEPPKLEETTEKLLILAVKNDNAGEASSAAIQACKRIYKELGYK